MEKYQLIVSQYVSPIARTHLGN